ncbi:MAPEG family protein [Zhongshania sp. BJYM1]|uniref:MAPEG family protein n=1 Tax=Zhongshania aquatica TaxID=2965069 RepID=UPI0022B552A1|nr:MAPEG family protein [Marortus sp. BJYM1]
MTTSLMAMAGYIGWVLLLYFVVIAYRGFMVMSAQRKADAWTRGRELQDSQSVKRIGDALSNSLETVPLFVGVILLAHVSDQSAVTDGLAPIYVGARVVQSVSHIISIHHLMIFLVRFPAFLVQVGLLAWWSLALTGLI